MWSNPTANLHPNPSPSPSPSPSPNPGPDPRSHPNAHQVSLMWSPKGDALLIHTHTEVDRTGKSYYGETGLFFMTLEGKARSKYSHGEYSHGEYSHGEYSHSE
jgi:hypothetical protein